METNDKIIEKNGKKYKLNLIIEQTATDIHHLLWLKYKNEYNVHIPQNKKRIPRRFHVRYNNFVEDKQNPRDAFKIVYELTKEILSEWVRQELYTLFYSTPDDMFYIPELIKKWKKKKNTTKKAMIEQNANTDSQSKAADNVYSKLFAD